MCAWQDEILQLTALYDLSLVAEAPRQAAHRRQALFTDESGGAWRLPVQVCIGMVRTWYACSHRSP